jgi:long-chain acyl-CoA synthetase
MATNIGNLLRLSALRNPHKTAVFFEGQRITYKDLDEATSSMAQWLVAQGCQAGDRIALYWPNSIELVKLLFACFKARIVAVPIYTQLKATETAHILVQSNAKMCFADQQHLGIVESAARESAWPGAIHGSLHEAEDAVDLADAERDDPALILYTSGTTNLPKGATHTHGTVQEGVKLLCSAAPDSFDTVLMMTPMAYISGIWACLLPAIALGSSVVVMPHMDAALALDLIEKHQCSFTFAPPPLAQFMLEEQASRPRIVRSLATFFVGGDSAPASLLARSEAVFGIRVREIYGMTELGLCCCNFDNDYRTGSLGKVVEGVEVRFVDTEGKDVLDGKSGEIIVRSPSSFVGYWENPKASFETLRDGWVYTGDLGHCDADGYIWFDDRKKAIIVRGGLNISPQEVEEQLYSHPEVMEAAVVGEPVPVHGERVVAFVALRDGAPITEDELKGHVGKRLADFKVPERVLFVPSLPKSAGGKINRRRLKDLAAVA